MGAKTLFPFLFAHIHTRQTIFYSSNLSSATFTAIFATIIFSFPKQRFSLHTVCLKSCTLRKLAIFEKNRSTNQFYSAGGG